MKFWKVIVATVLIFVSGFVSGTLITKAYIAKAEREWREGRRPWGPRYFVGRLDRDLDLTDEQRAQIENLLKQSQEDLKNLFDPISAQVREIHRKLREDIKAVLTAEQRETFEKIMDSRRGGPGRPGGRDRGREENRRNRGDREQNDRQHRGDGPPRPDFDNPPPDHPPADGPPPPEEE